MPEGATAAAAAGARQDTRITPIVAGAFTAPDGAGAIRLIGQHCRACGARFFPGGRSRCPRCHGAELTCAELDGRGTVDCFTVVRQAPAGYYGPVPYAVGSIALDGDQQVIAQLVGKEPDRWRCGEAVSACAFELPRDGEGRSIALCYGFRPDAARGTGP